MDRGPVETDLVLLGGGHSHLAVLRSFGMKPVPGVRLTLIARDVHTPYSGMLPGLVAGFYGFDEAHVDLRPLAAFAGARLYRASGVGLDLEGKRVLCEGRPPVPFDYLSINIGSTPRLPGGRADGIVPVKPIGEFVARWEALLERVRRRGGPVRVAVVGGGPGGVELSLAAHRRLSDALAAAGGGADAGGVECRLFTDTPEILPGLHPRARRRLRSVLASRGVRVHTGEAVRGVADGALVGGSGDGYPVDEVLWVTEAGAAPWLRDTGLALTDDGFIRLRDTLQSVSHPEVFAAGDIATMDRHPRDKAGVYAVRQGKPLARNLRRIAEGREPRPFRPQRAHLVLVGTADGEAVGARGPLVWRGASAWRLKDRIDRRFMRRYGELPEMASGGRGAAARPPPPAADAPMRCGGCGAKVGGDILGRVLARLKPAGRDDVLVGLDAPDDAAVAAVPAGKVSVQSVDFFRAFVADPYVFGAVTANHCLNDLFAMGARPQTALAVATVPFGRPSRVEDDLFQMLAGALPVLDEAGCALVGGHSGEGAELALGFAVNGLADPGGMWRKRGARPGEVLILTKPLGTGTLFAADMRGRAKGRWIDEALAVMTRSNAAAARILRDFGATAATDVTGFGLAGHLAEMVEGQGIAVELALDALPLLSGAIDTLGAGLLSTLDPENRRVESRVRRVRAPADDPRYLALFDPQTAGGLLASVPRAGADGCLAALEAAGYADAAVVGTVREGDPAGGAPITAG